MKNKGYVFLGVFALLIFFGAVHSCYLKMDDTVKEYDASMEKYKKEKRLNK